MANLFSLIRDTKTYDADNEVEVGPSGNRFTIVTRGPTAKYRDALAEASVRAARDLNRNNPNSDISYDARNLPPSVADRVQAEAMIQHCFIDVRGLNEPNPEGGDDIPVTRDRFIEYLRESTDLLFWMNNAVNRVGDRAAADLEAAAKN